MRLYFLPIFILTLWNLKDCQGKRRDAASDFIRDNKPELDPPTTYGPQSKLPPTGIIIDEVIQTTELKLRELERYEPPEDNADEAIEDGYVSLATVAGLPSDSFAESFNFLDGDSFGIGPLHEFVYGWQAIVNTMSMKNNVEVRKRAGLQRFALAGINGITLISHIGATEIMINGTRTYCFGGVSRPPGRRNIICRGAMYQELLFSCETPYLRYPTVYGYKYCVGETASIGSKDGTHKTTFCSNGASLSKFHHDYICERRSIKVKQVNLTDPNERYNIRNPVVRRAEYYRAPYDILKACPDWYGCNINISPYNIHQDAPRIYAFNNNTAFISHGGKYWLSLYETQLGTYATYFQAHSEYPWTSNRPVVTASNGIWEQLLKANIGPDMNLHYNLNGIYNRYPGGIVPPNIMNNDGQVQPANFVSNFRAPGLDEGAVEAGLSAVNPFPPPPPQS